MNSRHPASDAALKAAPQAYSVNGLIHVQLMMENEMKLREALELAEQTLAYYEPEGHVGPTRQRILEALKIEL